MDSDGSEHSDDELTDNEPQVQRKPKIPKRKCETSASQPLDTKKNRSNSVGVFRLPAMEDKSDLKTIISMLSKLQKDQTAFKSSVTKDLLAIKPHPSSESRGFIYEG